MAVVIIFSSFIGFASGLVDLAILGGGIWGALQTYLLVSFVLSLVLGTALALVRKQSRDEPSPAAASLARWDAWHAEEDVNTGRMIAKIAKSRVRHNQSA